MLKELINPEALNTSDLFNISIIRLEEIQNKIHAVTDKIADNYKDYLTTIDGRPALMTGKCVHLVADIAENENEGYFVAFCVDRFLQNVVFSIEKAQEIDAIKVIFPNANIASL